MTVSYLILNSRVTGKNTTVKTTAYKTDVAVRTFYNSVLQCVLTSVCVCVSSFFLSILFSQSSVAAVSSSLPLQKEKS